MESNELLEVVVKTQPKSEDGPGPGPGPSSSKCSQELELELKSKSLKSSEDEDGQTEPLIPVPDKNLLVLEDFVRFDIIRTGALCCTGYTISVQYEDEFLIGKSQQDTDSCGFYFCLCCFSTLFSPSAKRSMQFYTNSDGNQHGNQEQDQPVFSLEYTSRFCCFRPKKRRFTVNSALQSSKPGKLEQLGQIDTNSGAGDSCPALITNTWENRTFKSRKLRTTSFTLERGEDGVKVGIIDVFRGLRGAITSYGVSIVDDDVTPVSKALFVASVVAMDIEEREAEAKCSFLWTPLLSSVVVFLFTLIPWLYYRRNIAVLALPTPS